MNNGYPTEEEFKKYIELLHTMKANKFYIIGRGVGSIEDNLRKWIYQKENYYGWFKK